MKRTYDSNESVVTINLPDEMWLEIWRHVFPEMYFYREEMREALNARHISRHIRSLLDTQLFAKLDAFSGDALDAVRDTELLLFKGVGQLVVGNSKWSVTGAILCRMRWLKSLVLISDRSLSLLDLMDLRQLTSLCLYEPTETHRRSLVALTQLESLSLTQNCVIGDTDILSLTRLVRLCIVSDKRVTGSCFSGLRSLKRIELGTVTRVSDAQLLSVASTLKSLELSRYSNISNNYLLQYNRQTKTILHLNEGNKKQKSLPFFRLLLFVSATRNNSFFRSLFSRRGLSLSCVFFSPFALAGLGLSEILGCSLSPDVLRRGPLPGTKEWKWAQPKKELCTSGLNTRSNNNADFRQNSFDEERYAK